MLCLQGFFHVSISVFGTVCSLPSIYSLFISSIKYFGIQFVSVCLQSPFLFYSAILSSCVWALVLLNLCYQAVLFIIWSNYEKSLCSWVMIFLDCFWDLEFPLPLPHFFCWLWVRCEHGENNNCNPHRDCLIHISQSAHPTGLLATVSRLLPRFLALMCDMRKYLPPSCSVHWCLIYLLSGASVWKPEQNSSEICSGYPRFGEGEMRFCFTF